MHDNSITSDVSNPTEVPSGDHSSPEFQEDSTEPDQSRPAARLRAAYDKWIAAQVAGGVL